MIYINKLNKHMFDRKISYILCDFDRTISTYQSPTSWEVFQQSPLVSSEYREEATRLFDKYRPWELDLALDKKVKTEYMKQWALEQTSLFPKYNIDLNLYHRIIETSESIILRSDFSNFARKMYALDIPLYIVSGGLFDPIIFTLQQNNCLLPNIFISANRLKEKNRQIVGLQEPIIHSLNKDCISLPITQDSLGLLFGDLPSDKLLATNRKTINVGFINDEQLNTYNQEFDICLTERSSFEQIRKILIKK